MNAINWPEGFVPGFTDNFVSNEMIISGLNVNDVWPLLSQPLLWPEYYKNSADVRFYDNKGPELEMGFASTSARLVSQLKLRLWSLFHLLKVNLLVWHGTDGPVKKIPLNDSMSIMRGYWRIFPVTGSVS